MTVSDFYADGELYPSAAYKYEDLAKDLALMTSTTYKEAHESIRNFISKYLEEYGAKEQNGEID